MRAVRRFFDTQIVKTDFQLSNFWSRVRIEVLGNVNCNYLLLNLRSPRDYVVVPSVRPFVRSSVSPSVVRSRLWYVLDRLRACGMC